MGIGAEQRRLQYQPSSFINEQQAQRIVSRLFSENREAIKAWIKNPNSPQRFQLPDYIGNNSEIIGRGITKQEYLQAIQNGITPQCKNLYNARVVLKKTNDGTSYFILTSFPQ